jgi:heme-degrading monooxygenase HmoA
MFMRIVWGRIRAGEWEAFERAYRAGIAARGDVQGMTDQWLARDEKDPDAGYSISVWASAEEMRGYASSKKSKDALNALQPFFVNQYTVTECDIRYSKSA